MSRIIVPVEIIKKELLGLDLKCDFKVQAERVETILDKIYVCKMLKEENAGLKNKRSSDDYKNIIENDYKNAETPIEVVGFE